MFLLPNIDVRERADALTKAFFGETGTGHAGLSSVAGPREYPALVDEATSLAVAARNIGASGAVADAARLGFVGAALSSGQDRAERIIDNEIAPVIAYDRERGTELVATMHAYVKHNFNSRLTAEAMVIHPKTVSQRLSRIAALLGPDWAQYPRSLQVAAALELHRVREALETPERK